MKRKECVAMLLAGGQGSRLGALTKHNAKPNVSFGGKYRIIDFVLSNCVNSGIDTVGILTQYRPLLLNAYIGTGEAWDLDLSDGGVHLLPPYATETGGEWYEGTADAIYHNIDFIASHEPEYVLILSGDQLYNMDYSKMLDFHKKNNADLTVSVIEVPMEDAKRFGIMSTDEEMRITKFAEKPAEPESNLASMGIYIFNWDVLKKALLDDHKDPNSDRDFGKNIIPNLLAENKRLFAYTFSGYWKDVGTIDSYYSAHMELLQADPEFNVFDGSMRVFSNANIDAPSFAGPESDVQNSVISNGCNVFGVCKNSILGSGVLVDDGAVVTDSVLLPGAVIEKGAVVKRAIVGERTYVKEGAVIGKDDGEITLYSDDRMFANSGIIS